MEHIQKSVSCVFGVFVSPNWQGKGIGKLIVKTLEEDDIFKKSDINYLISTVYAYKFYYKLGWKNIYDPNF
jgi:GNAT superfamily N-acetyltransferase